MKKTTERNNETKIWFADQSQVLKLKLTGKIPNKKVQKQMASQANIKHLKKSLYLSL